MVTVQFRLFQGGCTLAVHMEKGDEITVDGAPGYNAPAHGTIWTGLSIALIR